MVEDSSKMLILDVPLIQTPADVDVALLARRWSGDGLTIRLAKLGQINLGQMTEVSTDFYALWNGSNFDVRYASSISMTLANLCDANKYIDKILCLLFEKDTGLSGAMRMFGTSRDGGQAGVMFDVKGALGLKGADELPDFMTEVLDFWPDNGASVSFNLMLSLAISGSGALDICVKANNNQACFSPCDSHDDCEEDEFCEDVFGVYIGCAKKVSIYLRLALVQVFWFCLV